MNRNTNRNTPEYKQWAAEVKKKAGYKCKMCGVDGNNGGGLHSHHIYPVAMLPQLALDPSNGICLCASCHNLAHGGKFKWKKK